MSSIARQRLTPEEYLATERAAESKSEFFAGEMFAVVDANEAHTLIRTNVWAKLSLQLKGCSCRVYSSDMRVKVSATGLYTYPDVVVVANERQFEDEQHDTLLNPTLIVEVVSPCTEAYDRGEKFAHYRRLESLREYVLIAQERLSVQRFVRQPDGREWLMRAVNDAQGNISLPTIGCELPLAEIYDKVDLPPEHSLVR
jgi:Uma2 family endonuclease